MIVIGVTGGWATGKSTVAQMFQELGAVVLDADTIAHEVIEPKRPAWRRIVEVFGEGVLNEDQTIDRKRLADSIFSDARLRQKLEAIVHPPVWKKIKQQLQRLRRLRRVPAVVLDVPLLVEVGAESEVDVLVVVKASPAVQRLRLKQSRGWSDEELKRRLAAQMDLTAKVALADYVVENSSGRKATQTQVKQIWNQRVRAIRR